MSRLRRAGSALVVLAFAIAVPVTASAQTCAGFTAIDPEHHGHGGAGLSFTKSTTGYGASLTGGSSHFIAGGTAGGVHDNDFDLTGFLWSGLIAGQFALDKDKKVSICPGVQVSRLSVHNVQGSGIDAARLTASAGVSFGVIASSTANIDLVPTFSVQSGRLHATATGQGSFNDTISVASLGVGVIVKKRFTIQPSASRPFGVAGAQTSYAINVTFRFERF